MDSFTAYLLFCAALGALHLAEALRWRGALGGRLHELWLAVDALWAVLSVGVVALAPSPAVRGVALWFALGTLGSWFLLRTGYLLVPSARGTRSLEPKPLPDWYREYMQLFALGLLTTAGYTCYQYVPDAPVGLIDFALQAGGALWFSVLVCVLVRAGMHLLRWLMQKGMDRGVLGGLQEHPRCRELFGDIERVKCQPEESARVTGDDVFVYRVEGSVAAGVVVAEFRALHERHSEVVQGLVYMDSGERSSLNVGSADAVDQGGRDSQTGAARQFPVPPEPGASITHA